MPAEERKRKLPSKIVSPLTLASNPCPSLMINSSGSGIERPASSAFLTIASPSGCSEAFSAPAASSKSCSGLTPSPATTLVTSGWPLVKVPVLSKKTRLTSAAFSRASPLLIRMPFSAARPVATITAVGVASPKAHGQAIIRTETKLKSALVRTGSGPKSNQIIKTSTAKDITTGTKKLAILSASR